MRPNRNSCHSGDLACSLVIFAASVHTEGIMRVVANFKKSLHSEPPSAANLHISLYTDKHSNLSSYASEVYFRRCPVKFALSAAFVSSGTIVAASLGPGVVFLVFRNSAAVTNFRDVPTADNRGFFQYDVISVGDGSSLLRCTHIKKASACLQPPWSKENQNHNTRTHSCILYLLMRHNLCIQH
uniref:Uncharacterized protein n=1 Tax=Photinus pyralis TaxID=7054 RepID=A0A1Y1N4Q0_PHOPY